jgi:hypothetical protein
MILFFQFKKINKYSYKFVYNRFLKDYSSWKRKTEDNFAPETLMVFLILIVVSFFF